MLKTQQACWVLPLPSGSSFWTVRQSGDALRPVVDGGLVIVAAQEDVSTVGPYSMCRDKCFRPVGDLQCPHGAATVIATG